MCHRLMRMPHIHNAAHILLTQSVFRTILSISCFGINHKNAFAIGSIFFIEHNDTGWNTGTIKQVGR
ncbi:hypothetical protein SDC9_192442 [bioreactor metagenome]|uniref:Uncharacterized protein n=1 Tax=bioreactor metagenome TaxID=1076179 RepID=A0A645I0R8_9ZZZZ